MRRTATPVIPFFRAALIAAGLALAACAPQPTAGVALPAAPAAPQSRGVAASGPVQVALLLPRGAAEAGVQALAADIEAAARLAAAEAGAGRIELRVFDTAASPAQAAQAAQAAVNGGAAILLGPLYSATTRAVRPVATGAGVTALSFSSDSAAGGAPVFVMGDLPENEADRLMGYAASQGVGTLAITRPQSDYGALSERAVRESAARHGVRVVHTLSYPRSFEGVQAALGEGAPGVRASGAEGVLIADGGQALRAVAAFLDYHDVSPRSVRFMGLGLWRNPETLQEPTLRGGWFAGPDPAAAADFEARFRAATGRAPHPLAWMGHDAVRAVAQLLAQGGAAPFAAQAVANSAGFDGARGPWRFTPAGANQRALAVFEVTEEGFVVRDPAPAALGAGS